MSHSDETLAGTHGRTPSGTPGGPQEADPEMAAWRSDWQAPTRGVDKALAEGAAQAIRRQVRRRSLGLLLMTFAETLFAVTAITVLSRLARSLGTPLDAFTMTTFAALTACALGFSLWNRWGIWRPSAESTAAYLELSLLRCRRRQRGLRMAWGLLGLEVALFVPWIAHRIGLEVGDPGKTSEALRAYGFLALVAGLAAAILLALDRRTRRELRELEELRRGLLEEG